VTPRPALPGLDEHVDSSLARPGRHLTGFERIPAVEILLANPSVKKLISESREADLPSVIRSCVEEGMIDLTDSLCKLISNGSVEPKEAYKYAPNVDAVIYFIRKIST